jgi:hypothetical protein
MFWKFFKVFSLLLVVFSCKSLSAQDFGNIKITASYTKTPMLVFLADIEKNYPVKFYYKDEWFKGDSISINLDQTPLSRILDRIADTKPFTYQVIQGNLIVFLPKEQVATLLGQMLDMSSGSGSNILSVGDPAEVGKFRRVEIKGKIKDGKNGEALIGANIQIEKTTIGCQTGVSGAYSLNLAPGLYTFIVTCIGYEKSTYKIKLISNGSIDLELFEKSTKIDEITIYAQRPDKNVRNNQMSLVDLDSKGIKQLPSLTGQKDIIRSFTLMPGVKSVGEFGSGINVRGGGEDQNLYLIEGAPIFNTSHVFGLMSVINPDAVSSVALYKGQIPAMYGEKVSSVMDIQLRDNNCKIFKAIGGIGLYDSRLMVEGPAKNNITYKIGGRTSYSNWLLRSIPDINIQNSKANFYDVNALVNWNYKNDRVSVFGYYSNDYFKYASEQAFNYGNAIGSINWGHYFNENLSSTLLLAYSQYSAEKDDIKVEFEKRKFSTQIRYASGKYNLKYTGLQKHTFDAGLQLIRYSVLPGKMEPLDTLSVITSKELANEQALEGGIYLNDAWELSEKWAFNLGVRFSGYSNLGPSTVLKYNESLPKMESSVVDTIKYGSGKPIKLYGGIEPRFSIKFQYNQRSSIKFSYNRNIQYMSLVSYTSISTPSDIWKLNNTYLKPITSDQVALGYYRNNRKNTIEASFEVYYKKLSNLPEYKNNAVIEMNPFLEQELLNAEGRNYGIEIMLKKNKGKIDGWISYTYSRSLRQVNSPLQPKINGGNEYASSYDKPHDITVFGTYHINKRWRIGANFNYSTGRPVTLPEYIYKSGGKDQIVVFSDRNKYRLPDYHRLDLSISMDESLRISKRWKGSWTFAVLNVYSRHNTYSVFYKKSSPSAENNYQMYSLYKLYIIGQWLPTLTYNFIF